MRIQGFFSITSRAGFQGCKRIYNNNVHDAPNVYSILYTICTYNNKDRNHARSAGAKNIL
jgi:hypothetical protein